MTEHTQTPAESPIDPITMREKYRLERDKRLRADGLGQYQYAGEQLDVDLYSSPVQRDPVDDEVEVVVLGGGLTGIGTAVRLHQEGVTDVRIIEKGSDFGGTWYWNRYPGVRCDIESYIYLPFLEEVGTIPTEKYAKGLEILRHLTALCEKYGLYGNALLQTEVTRVEWDDTMSRWVISTNRGDTVRARFLNICLGTLSRPKLPRIPGIGSFLGTTFHTSRWDYGYTGGNTDGGMTKLADKRVAVIGTGATAIQCVPGLGAAADHLYVFQRTPASVGVRGNGPTDLAWFQNQPEGWQTERMVNFDSILSGRPVDKALVVDGWNATWGRLANTPSGQRQAVDFEIAESIRRRVDEVVEDPAVADVLKAYYDLMCKRPTFSDEYLPTFNRPNVTLVDTDGRGVDRITEKGVVANGVEYEVDLIVFATGFGALVPPWEAGAFDIIGKAGRSLQEHWASGIRSLHGVASHGFPNMFFIGGKRHATGTSNATLGNLRQAGHVAQLIAQCVGGGHRVTEVTHDAEERWARELAEKAVDRSAFEAECTPSYFNNERDTTREPVFSSVYGGGPFAYFAVCDEWLASGGIERDTQLT